MRWLLVIALLASVATANAPRTMPLVHPPLAWSMDPETAYKALTRAKLSPERSERRAYFASDNGPVHTIEPEVIWKIAGGQATARFQWSAAATDYRLDEIQLFRNLTDDAVTREIAALDKRFGKPHSATVDSRLWVRGGIWLVVAAQATPDPKTGLRYFTVAYRRDDRPAP